MKYCRFCGNQLTDHATYCPKCGTRIRVNNDNHKAEGDNSIIQEEKLSTGEKIALWVAVFLAFTGIIGGISEGSWIITIISLCAMAAIIAVCIEVIEKRYAMKTAIAASVIVFVAIGIFGADKKNKENEQKQAQAEQEQESPADVTDTTTTNEADAYGNGDFSNYVGKWRLDKTSDGGQKMRMEIMLKADKSGEFVVFHLKGSSDDVLVYEEYPQCILVDGVIYLTKNGEIIKGKTPQLKVGSDGLYSFDNQKYVRVYD